MLGNCLFIRHCEVAAKPIMKAIVTNITLHQQSRTLDVTFSNGEDFTYPFEYLRVFSPSAEVRGHGKGQEKLVLNKENINITSIEPVGNYGIKPRFDDGHATGIFSWDELYLLGKQYQANWQSYLEKVKQHGIQAHGSK